MKKIINNDIEDNNIIKISNPMDCCNEQKGCELKKEKVINEQNPPIKKKTKPRQN